MESMDIINTIMQDTTFTTEVYGIESIRDLPDALKNIDAHLREPKFTDENRVITDSERIMTLCGTLASELGMFFCRNADILLRSIDDDADRNAIADAMKFVSNQIDELSEPVSEP